MKHEVKGVADVMQMPRDVATPVPRPQSGSMSVYKPAYAVEVVDFMGKGFSLTAFAGEIGQSFEVICDWMRDCPEFAVAVAKGRAKRVRGLEETFLTTENGPKVASHKHALNNAAPHEWRDRVEHTGADGKDLPAPATIDVMELARQMALGLEIARRRVTEAGSGGKVIEGSAEAGEAGARPGSTSGDLGPEKA